MISVMEQPLSTSLLVMVAEGKETMLNCRQAFISAANGSCHFTHATSAPIPLEKASIMSSPEFKQAGKNENGPLTGL